MELQILKKSEGSFTVTCEKSVLDISYQVPITIHYDQCNPKFNGIEGWGGAAAHVVINTNENVVRY